ncbi:MAG: HlyC/CorC family transporter [Anaerolineaceae bacterium]|nr:HlyC/CorC family transporter [Anaerolineaceae bacterium]
MSFIDILIILGLILINGLFVGIEFALVLLRRPHFEENEKPDLTRTEQIVHHWIEDPHARDQIITLSQAGIIFSTLALGAFCQSLFSDWLITDARLSLPRWLNWVNPIVGILPYAFAFLLVGMLHFAIGEQIPRAFVHNQPEPVALRGARLMNFLSRFFSPLLKMVDWFTRVMLTMFELPVSSLYASIDSAEDIKELVSSVEAEGVIEEPEREMLSAVIDFGDLTVHQVSIPRVEVIAVQAGTPISEVIEIGVQNNLTKMPVYENSLEQIVGIVHLLDLLKLPLEDRNNPLIMAKEHMREALFIPENIPASTLLHQFQLHHTHIAIVVDEYGGMDGLVTLEDLMDEIFGEVQDAFDESLATVRPLTDGSMIIEGRMLIEDFNQYFNLDLPDDTSDTIAGYMLAQFGHIPEANEMVYDPQARFSLEVKAMDHLRISQIVMRLL